MRSRLLIFALLCGSAFAGTCPSTASYRNPANPTGPLVTLASLGVTTCFYIDPVGGSDSAAGTSESVPWQHAPSMANATSTAAAHTPGAGEGWIFKGGESNGSASFPMAPPWAGTVSAPDFLGADPAWYTGVSWQRPIFSMGGSSGYNASNQDPISDAAHHGTSNLIIENIEGLNLYIGATCSTSNANNCGFIAQYAYSGSDTNWFISDVYFHGWSCPTVASVVCPYDPGNSSSFLWADQGTTSVLAFNVIDGSDSSQNCCNAMAAWTEAYNYIGYVDNAEFGEIGFFHDNVITNMVPPSGPTADPVHGNCIHLFGSNPVTEIVYNNSETCLNSGTGDEMFEVEETNASAHVWAFNNVMMKDGHGSGLEQKQPGTVTFFDNTQECGTDPVPTSSCIDMYASAGPVFAYNNAGFTSNSNQNTVINSHGTLTASPVGSVTCSGGVQNKYGGTQICAPIGSGNGAGNLNLTQTYPFAPLDPTAGASVGNASNLASLCATVPNPAAATACLSDTTLGVSYNTTNHTVSWPARSPLAHPAIGNWTIGAYETATNVQSAIAAVDAPVLSSQTNNTAFSALVTSPNPLLTYQEPGVFLWNGGSSAALGFDQESMNGVGGVLSPIGNISFTAVDNVIASYPTALIIEINAEGNTSGALPQGLYSQNNANAVALTWTANTVLLPSWYICVGGSCPTSGKYWQVQNGSYTGTGYGNTVVTGATIPAFPNCIVGCTIGSTSVADGAGATAFNWIFVGSNAPLQDAACTSNHTCTGSSTSCYAANGNAPILLNLGTVGVGNSCTLTQFYGAQAVPWELPAWTYWKQVVSAIIPNLNVQPNLGYVRFGSPGGGEFSVPGQACTIWPYQSSAGQCRAQFISYVNLFDAFIIAQGPTFKLASDENCVGSPEDCQWADQEALAAYNNGFDILGNQDVQINDVYDLYQTSNALNSCQFPLQSAAAIAPNLPCTQGNWAYNAVQYPSMITEIQGYNNGSTPLDCANTGVGGPLGALSPSTYCPLGTVGLLQSFVNMCTTGVGSPLVKICPKIFESHTGSTTACTGNLASCYYFTVNDTLLALSPTYSSTTGAVTVAAPSQAAYKTGFANFLGITLQTLTVTVTGAGMVSDSLGVIVACGASSGTCSGTVPSGAIDTLTASTVQSWAFTGFGSPCPSSPNNRIPCTITIGANTNLSAAFSPLLTAPLYPAARTDLATIGTQAILPNMGSASCTISSPQTCGNLLGAGTVITDPNFGSQICRVTDASFDPFRLYSPMNASSSGSGEEMHINAADTMIDIADDGARDFPANWYFCKPGGATAMYVSATGGGFWTYHQGFQWAHNPSTPNRGYVTGNGTHNISNGGYGTLLGYYDFTNQATVPSFTQMEDYTASGNCLPNGFIVGYATGGGSGQTDTDFAVGFGGGTDWVASAAHNTTDLVITLSPTVGNAGGYLYQVTTSGISAGVGLEPAWGQTIGGTTTDGTVIWTNVGKGGQGQAGTWYAAVYRVGNGCQLLNVYNKAKAGDWGTNGTVTGTGCVDTSNGVAEEGIHNVKIFKIEGVSGTLELTMAGNCGSPGQPNMYWAYAQSSLTNSFMILCPSQCSGHETSGLTTWVNNAGNPAPNFIVGRTLSNLTPFGIVPALPTAGYPNGWDFHPGWNALNDSYPFFSSTYSETCLAVATAWDNEILGFNPAGTQNPLRFSGTFNTGCNQDFGTQIAVGSVSSDSTIYMFTSDWMNTLGSITNTATCVPNGPSWKASTSYPAALNTGGWINPPTSVNAGNYSYQATTAGTSGATQPTPWPQTPGGTITDNGVTWTASTGPASCRGDVFVVQLSQPAGVIAPYPPAFLGYQIEYNPSALGATK